MPPEILDLKDELAAAISIEDERLRVEKIVELAPTLPDELLDQALVATNYLQDDSVRGSALSRLAPYLKGEQLKKAVTFASRMYNYAARNVALGSLGPHLSEESRAEVIEIVRNTTGNFDRLKGWMGLAPFLSSDLKQEAITTALTLTNEQERAEALIALAPHLPDVWKTKALESARNISNLVTRVYALSGLVPALPKRERAEALNEALDLARTLTAPIDKALALLDLISLVPDDLKDDLENEAYEAAGRIPDSRLRLGVLIELATKQSSGRRAATVEKTLSMVTGIDDEAKRGEALVVLAGAGFPDVQNRLLKAAKEINDPKVKSNVIIQLRSIIEQEPLPPPAPAAAPAPAPAISEPPAELLPTGPPPVQDFPDAERDKPAEPSPPTGGGALADPDVSPAPTPSDQSQPAAEESKPAKAKTPRRKAPKVTPPRIDEEPEPSSTAASRGVKAFLHSDRWTLEDQLDYKPYADAITEFILHPDTKPPLAIGILAPWGQGKSTLMRLIQNQLQVKVQGQVTGSPAGVVVPPITPTVKFSYLRQWIQDPTNYKLDESQLLRHPTVWFNAWKYQNTEQLLAGMAYSILSQLVEQIETQEEREKFWLALQAERIDFNAIRTDIHRMIFERVAPWIGISIVIAVLGVLLVIVGYFAGNIIWGTSGGMVMLAGVLVPAVKWLVTSAKVNSKPLEGKFAQYVRQPTYEGKLGFFHEVEMDVQRVFRLLIAPGKPAVVFIDDLDRCSPGTVAQVIEAMNLFLSAEFPDCYFVVGMDAQVVAASMEVAYENLDKKMKGVTRSYGSLGWYFMDKFIQLQFSIPNLTDEQRSSYLNKLMGQADTKTAVPPAELDRLEQQLEENLNSATLKTEEMPEQAVELSKLRVQRPQTWQRLTHTLIKARAQQLTDDNPALQKQIQRYERFLGASPRGIKRFTNLLRFYDLCQVTRRAQGLPASSESALARWLVIMLRWPQVVRWIQWEGEAKFNAGASALRKAEVFEEELLSTKDHAAWIKYLKSLDPDYMEWMGDRQLYEFLKTTARPSERLSLAVQTGVW